jgi:diguanylate cyclase (GGDEF)-like protein
MMTRFKSKEFYYMIATTFLLAIIAGLISVGLILILELEQVTSLIIAAITVNTILMIIIDIYIANTYMSGRERLQEDLMLKDILYNLLHETSLKHSVDEVYDLILKAAVKAIPQASRGTIIDATNPGKVIFKSCIGYDMDNLMSLGLKREDTYLYRGTNGSMNHTVIIDDVITYNNTVFEESYVDRVITQNKKEVRSAICTPIVLNEEVFGMLNVDSHELNAFSEKDIETLKIFSFEVGRMIQYTQVMKENVYLSRYDSMTNVYNRGYFYELHKKMFKDPKVPSYIFIATDLYNLKEVNDTYGHATGDKLIRHFTSTITKILDGRGVFGRYGGDEFNILLPNGTTSEAYILIEDVNESLKHNPIIVDYEKIYVSFSYGIVKHPDNETDYNELVKLADQKMYAHKNAMKV